MTSLPNAMRRWEKAKAGERRRRVIKHINAARKEEEKVSAKERERRLDVKHLEQRQKDVDAGRKPSNIVHPQKLVDIAVRKNWTSKKYQAALKTLSLYAVPTEEQMAKLAEARLRGPNYLGRTVSLTAGYKFNSWSSGTNGSTTQYRLMPAADITRSQATHANMAGMSQGEVIYMIGQHLIWNDLAGDEFLSYSIDPLFLVYHALGRYHKAQHGVTVQFIDRRKAKSINGEPAAFYHALDIYDIFGVGAWTGWPSRTRGKLLPRKFTQEFLSHGTVKNADTRFQQATLDDLIRDGLYDLFPTFKVKSNELRAGLYSGQVILRTIGFPPPEVQRPLKRKRDDDQKKREKRIYAYHDCPRVVAFTIELLTLVQKLTRNFINVQTGQDRDVLEPPLHVFICFLTFEKRPSRDSTFIEWIKAHYNASDVADIYTNSTGSILPGFTDVADNLPGVLQYLDLLRDAIFAFGLPQLPANQVEKVNASTGREYAGEDDRRNRNKKLATEYDEEAHRDGKERARQKRHAKARAEREAKAGGQSVTFVADGKKTEAVGERADSEGSAEMSESDGDDSDEEAAAREASVEAAFANLSELVRGGLSPAWMREASVTAAGEWNSSVEALVEAETVL